MPAHLKIIIMWSEFNFVTIHTVVDRILRHPLMQELTFEAAVQYLIDFLGIFGLPQTYTDEYAVIDIKDFRGLLPCDCIAINQVRECKSGRVLSAMSDSFNGTMPEDRSTGTFKTQGRMIYTSFRDGEIEISYKAIPTDKDGLPMLPDNPVFMKTLELYIKKEWFTVLFDMGRISPAVLQNTQQEYYIKAGQLNNEFLVPSVAEMESITNMMNQLIPRTNEFNKSFRHLGDKEYWRIHR